MVSDVCFMIRCDHQCFGFKAATLILPNGKRKTVFLDSKEPGTQKRAIYEDFICEQLFGTIVRRGENYYLSPANEKSTFRLYKAVVWRDDHPLLIDMHDCTVTIDRFDQFANSRERCIAIRYDDDTNHDFVFHPSYSLRMKGVIKLVEVNGPTKTIEFAVLDP